MKKILCSVAVFALVYSCGSLKKTKDSGTTANKGLTTEYIASFHEGIRYKLRGQYKEAIQAFEYCIAKNPSDDVAYYALSELYLETQQSSKAESAILKASKLDPSNNWYMEELGYMYYQKGNYAEASRIFQKLTQKNERNIDWWFIYAECLLKNKDVNGSIKALDKLEELTGKNTEIVLEKFKMYRSIKQDDKAEKELIKGMEEIPGEPKILANLIDYYFEKGKIEKAYTVLKKLADSDPNNGIANIALAEYYFRNKEESTAIPYLKSGILSDNVTIDQKVSFLLEVFNNKTKIEPEMLQAVDLMVEKYPSDAKSHTLQGDFYLWYYCFFF